ncbi:MAG: helix-turn-helix transcriptional regulator [Pseudomonadota bacterium]
MSLTYQRPCVCVAYLRQRFTQTGQMSTQKPHFGDYPTAVAIRRLRGRMTQKEFSEKVGVSRSALANYETGRSAPNIAVLRDMANAMGVPETELTAASLADVADDAQRWGLVADGDTHVTEDEVAFVRLLRLTQPDVVKDILEAMVSSLIENNAGRNIGDYIHVKDDLARSNEVIRGGGVFAKGHVVVSGRKSEAQKS